MTETAKLFFERLSHNSIDQIESIEVAASYSPWSRSQIEQELNLSHGVGLGLFCNGELKAFIFLRIFAGEAEITNIVVDKNAQGQGFGSALLKNAIEYCQAEEVVTMHLEVRESNLVAIRLYQQHGFSQVGRREAYYSRNAEDALLFSKKL